MPCLPPFYKSRQLPPPSSSSIVRRLIEVRCSSFSHNSESDSRRLFFAHSFFDGDFLITALRPNCPFSTRNQLRPLRPHAHSEGTKRRLRMPAAIQTRLSSHRSAWACSMRLGPHAAIRKSHRMGFPRASSAQPLPHSHLLKIKSCNDETPEPVKKYRLHLFAPT
jgi:hypothetical protein